MCLEKFLKKIAGITKLEDGLKKLDKMTNEEARMANAEAAETLPNIDKKVEVVDEKCKASAECSGSQEGWVIDEKSIIDENVREERCRRSSTVRKCVYHCHHH
jgi:hypothetical protein